MLFPKLRILNDKILMKIISSKPDLPYFPNFLFLGQVYSTVKSIHAFEEETGFPQTPIIPNHEFQPKYTDGEIEQKLTPKPVHGRKVRMCHSVDPKRSYR